MKLRSCILILVLGIASISGDNITTSSLDSKTQLLGEYKEGQRYIYYYPEDREPILVDLLEVEPEHRYNVKNKVNFVLHTRRGEENLKFLDDAAFKNSNFIKDGPVKIIVHGWLNGINSPINKLITEALLRSDDLNVILVDWSTGAGCLLYTSSVRNVYKVGPHVADLIDWLNTNGIPLKSFHLIGHSLGAHIVGIAGRSVANGSISHITALDPAYPLWSSSKHKVASGDADYVEIIHTNSGLWGMKYPSGDNDFYPNKGVRQRGCKLIEFSCSHSRAYELFADSMDHKSFMADQCTNYEEMVNGKCAKLSQMKMGGSYPKKAVGIFYLETNRHKPFSRS